MNDFTRATLLLFVLLNPFTMSVYLHELLRAMSWHDFARQLWRAALISYAVFLVFALAGDRIFQDVLQVRFLSFMIFGGVTFLIVGTRLILGGAAPVQTLRPDSEHVSAAIAMPFMVGPGTISASVLAGSRLPIPLAAVSVGSALVLAMLSILVIKSVHDWVKTRNERAIARYTEIAGRVVALFTGSFAVEMILSGIERWLALLSEGDLTGL